MKNFVFWFIIYGIDRLKCKLFDEYIVYIGIDKNIKWVVKFVFIIWIVFCILIKIIVIF